ncbi:hypothetical protein [Scytonema hofmannii]|nr:hypothetical protein [Scytonema hofmannii]
MQAHRAHFAFTPAIAQINIKRVTFAVMQPTNHTPRSPLNIS